MEDKAETKSMGDITGHNLNGSSNTLYQLEQLKTLSLSIGNSLDKQTERVEKLRESNEINESRIQKTIRRAIKMS
jgi:hypothetical protein